MSEPAVIAARAEMYLTLAHAFTAPRDEGVAEAFRQDLAGDLTAAAAAAGYLLGEAPARLEAALVALAGPQALARLYATLFLAPPAPVHINAAIYLDGAPLGPSELAMRKAYERHGLVPAAALRDLCDHVARQLEFVAVLLARAAAAEPEDAAALEHDARAFLATFIARWLPPFRDDLARICRDRSLPDVYPALAEILEACVAAEVPARAPAVPAEPAHAAPSSGAIGAADLAAMAAALEARGLSSAHLRAHPAWPDDLPAEWSSVMGGVTEGRPAVDPVQGGRSRA
jgi:putative dimethyl sulfoxide reductase chaperone